MHSPTKYKLAGAKWKLPLISIAALFLKCLLEMPPCACNGYIFVPLKKSTCTLLGETCEDDITSLWMAWYPLHDSRKLCQEILLSMSPGCWTTFWNLITVGLNSVLWFSDQYIYIYHMEQVLKKTECKIQIAMPWSNKKTILKSYMAALCIGKLLYILDFWKKSLQAICN